MPFPTQANPVDRFLTEVDNETASRQINALIHAPFSRDTDIFERNIRDSYFINRNYRAVSLDAQTSGNTWVFFTKPYLSLGGKNANICDFNAHPAATQEFLAQNLNALQGSPGGAFIPLLTNLYKKGNVIEDETAESYKLGETFEDHSMTVSHGGSHRSFNGEFSCTFQEIRGMFVSSLFSTITKYIYGAHRGKIERSMDSRARNYVDYFMTMYVIVTDVDNESILYWSSYTGITPKSIGYTGITSDGNITAYEPNVSFSYSVRTAMRLSVLTEFAMLCTENFQSLTTGKERYNPAGVGAIIKGEIGFSSEAIGSVGKDNPGVMSAESVSFSSTPYIDKTDTGFKLRFRSST